MNIGIVTTWFDRGASYVSKQYMEILQSKHNVFIYARSGEIYAKGDSKWDLPNVFWSKKLDSPFVVTTIDKREFVNWITKNKIETVLFNEQHWWYPLIWCKEMNVKTIAYIDYYTEQTVPLFGIYDILICNTHKHYKAFDWHPGARYIPWGTNIDIFKRKTDSRDSERLVFFHSCGFAPTRKGTDLLLKAIKYMSENNFRVIIHTQINISKAFPELTQLIEHYIQENKLEIIQKTVPSPGLYSMGDVYVYPSRLEGIGLTIAEAISSGLCVIVPDCAPMNEFVDKDFGRVVAIERLYSRQDGYYWPQNQVNVRDLARQMDWFVQEKRNIELMKTKARQYAEINLNWTKNASQILETVSEDQNHDVKMIENAVQKIIQFEKYGIRKYNHIFMRHTKLFTLLFKLIK